jgi:hypothetical protein
MNGAIDTHETVVVKHGEAGDKVGEDTKQAIAASEFGDGNRIEMVATSQRRENLAEEKGFVVNFFSFWR